MAAKRKGKRKTIRHNTAASQEKHRADWQPLEPNELGVVADRRIMPRDERDRRLAIEEASAQGIDAAFDDSAWEAAAAASQHRLGIVVEVAQGLCRVKVDGRVLLCDIRGTLTAEGTGFTNIVAVGDRALVSLPESDHGLVEEVLPRRSALARADTFAPHLRQIIAANMDQLLIVASWRQPHLWLELIDEYLIGAARNKLDPIVCVNKIDLAEDAAECRATVQPYAELGRRVLFTSARTGDGVDELRAALRGKSTVLAGLSGVGKSSLLSAVQPGLALRTQAVSDYSGEGRHTTSQVTMLPLSTGGYVVDTPGIRELGLRGLYRDELIAFYPELLAEVSKCRYNDCSHIHEPECGVKGAVAEGRVAGWRYENYTKLYAKLLA
jgi:ribosome biogenesis GTPase